MMELQELYYPIIRTDVRAPDADMCGLLARASVSCSLSKLNGYREGLLNTISSRRLIMYLRYLKSVVRRCDLLAPWVFTNMCLRYCVDMLHETIRLSQPSAFPDFPHESITDCPVATDERSICCGWI